LRYAQNGLKKLAKALCFLPDKSHPTRHLTDGYFAAQNTVINGISKIESIEVIKEMLRQGFGMSILPDWVVKDELKAGIFTAFSPGRRHLRQSWGLLRLRGRPVTAIENSFQVLCAKAAKSLQSAPIKSGTSPK
jgi:DNA-binding transcriptional LysR family regulator